MAGHPGGMTYRNITEPPVGARLRYYLGFRLPIEYREWIERDIASDAWPKRGAVILFVVLVAILLIATSITREPWVLRFSAAPVMAALFYRFNVMDGAYWTGQRVLWRHHRYWGVK